MFVNFFDWCLPQYVVPLESDRFSPSPPPHRVWELATRVSHLDYCQSLPPSAPKPFNQVQRAKVIFLDQNHAQKLLTFFVCV